MGLIRILLAVVVIGGAGVVVAGVGQGSPPASPGGAPSAADLAAQAQRIAGGTRGVGIGRRLFVSEGCSSCHTVAAAGSDGKLGPRLDVVLKDTPRAIIMGFIVDPAQVMLPGYDNNLMPRDYRERLTGGELRALTSFLAAAAG